MSLLNDRFINRLFLVLFMVVVSVIFLLNFLKFTEWDLKWSLLLIVLYLLINAFGRLNLSLNYFFSTHFKGKESSNLVAVKFIDVLNEKALSDILSVLTKYEIKGSFFFTGNKLEGKEELISKLNNGEHLIGHASFDGPKGYYFKSKEKLLLDFEKVTLNLRNIINKTPRVFHLPINAANKNIALALSVCEHVVVKESILISDKDFVNQRNVDTKLKSVSSGDIIRVEVGEHFNNEMLVRLIEHIASENLTIVRVDKLLDIRAYD